jgi:competence ComEA-like helix-hairpin-helix protein
MCVPCHGVLRAVAERKTARGWAATVDSMREKGAKGSDDQAAAVVVYLSAHFAAVDVNTATADELVNVAGLSPEDAAAIIAFRGDGHPFKSYSDLKKVTGVDPKRLTAAKSRLVYAPK